MVHTLKKEMIDIKSEKEKVARDLQELEFEFAQGNISKNAYNSQKSDLKSKIETLEVADRIKRLQGRGEAEKPLEYWTEKKEEEKEQKAKEELMKKYITSSSPDHPSNKIKRISGKKNRAALFAILALIFIIGIGFGVFLMKVPGESTAVPMTINQSAFPTINNSTNITNTSVSTTNLTGTTSSSNSNTGSNTNTGGSTGNSSNTP